MQGLTCPLVLIPNGDTCGVLDLVLPKPTSRFSNHFLLLHPPFALGFFFPSEIRVSLYHTPFMTFVLRENSRIQKKKKKKKSVL
jgi:hypothetical protein